MQERQARAEARVPVSRTVVIGLGGTGVASALYMKREFINHFGEMPAVVQVVCFDTDSKFDPLKDIYGGTVTLGRDEFVHLTVPAPQATLQALANLGQNEFPQGRTRLRALTDGASQLRALGRLSVLANADRIMEHLNMLLGAVLSQAAEDSIRASERFQLYDDLVGAQNLKPVTVYILCSLAGGMGSGSFIDIAYLCRQLLAQTQYPEAHKIIGIFLLPPIFETRAATAYIYGNTYAALMELDHLMSRPVGQEGIVDNVVYSSTLSIPWHQFIPFDQVYLIDNWNESGNREDNLHRFYQLIGHAVFLNVSVTAESIRANIRGGTQLPDWDGKQPLYAGLGIANIEIPIELIIQETIALTTLDFLTNHMMRSEQQDYDRLVSDCMLKWQIDEETRDDVINRLIDGPEVTDLQDLQDNRGHLTVHKLKDRANRIKNWMRNQREKSKAYGTKAENNLLSLLKQVQSEIDTEIKNIILNKGVHFTRIFLSTLKSRVNLSKEMMEQESRSFDPTRIQYPKEQEINEACSAFWRRPAVESLVNTIRGKIDEELRVSFERTRRDYARQFFEKLAEYVDGWLRHVDAVHTNVQAAITRVNGDIQETRERIAREKFNLLLRYSDLREDIEELKKAERIDNSLIVSQLTPEIILRWGDQPGSEQVIQDIKAIIAKKITEALRWDDRERKGLKVDKVLARMYPDTQQLTQVLNEELVQRASPWWRYNAALATGRKLFSVLIFGSQFANDTILQQIDLSQLGLPEGSYTITSTGDPYRLTALKYRFAVPAFAIGGVEPTAGGMSYASRYKSIEGPTFTHHIRNQWVGGQNLQPLGPSLTEQVGGSEEAREYWAVALAKPFELIRFEPLEGYYLLLKPSEKAKEKKIFLGDKRLEAFRKFCSQVSWLAEVKSRVIEIVKEQGVQSVVNNLTKYVEETEAAIDSGEFSPEVASFIEDLELEALNKFVGKLRMKG